MPHYVATFLHKDGSSNSEIIPAAWMEGALVLASDDVRDAEQILSSPVIKVTVELTEQ